MTSVPPPPGSAWPRSSSGSPSPGARPARRRATARPARIAVVQPGNVTGPERRFDANVELTRESRARTLDLVVWGESSVAFDEDPESSWQPELEELSAAVEAPLLVNVDARRGEGGIFKSSVLVDAAGVEGRYDKMRLVPFGEYVPLRPLFGWVTAVTDAPEEDRRRGPGLETLDVDGFTIGPLVCFESAFPDLTRLLADDGADVVVVQSATTTFQGSWAQPQHASLGAVRAVESGRPVVHAAVSGTTAAFDADGNRLAWLPSDETRSVVVPVALSTRTTPFVRWGDWVPVLCAALLLGAVSAALIRSRRSTWHGDGRDVSATPSDGDAHREPIGKRPSPDS
ncbi:MAG: apolipoprotein N-acyltransferase [Acidimicrobiia bacterium]|nr:apolipoprotein N-acyltransferase [Acidimicrobiia bacterium]